ncbi:exported protein of unknown function [Hyphomicrobium sp. 1Nfss2.1]
MAMAGPKRIQRGRWRLPVAAFSFLGLVVGSAAEPTGTGVEVIPVVPAVPQAAPTAPLPPRVPVPIIRFRCTVENGASGCRESSDVESCDCARDFCYRDPAGVRICEKS